MSSTWGRALPSFITTRSTSRRRALEDIIGLMINTDDEDEYAQSTITLKKLFDTFREGELDDEIRRCSFSVLCQMHRELDNERSQKRGRRVLAELEDARERNDAPWDSPVPVRDAIVEFIEIHAADASAARFGFELIRCGEIANLDLNITGHWDVSQTTVNIAVECMVRHELDPVVQEYAMRSIFGADDNLDVDYREVLDACLEAMHNHPHNSNVQMVACCVLCLFHEKYELITRVEWPPATILQALNNHVHCPKVQTSVCGCLAILLRGVQLGRDYIKANLPTPVGEAFFLSGRDYIEVILQTLRTHPTNEEVQRAAMYVLVLMTYESTNLNRIIQGGAVDFAIQFMRISDETPIRSRDAVRVLKPLLKYSTDARREAIKRGAIPMLLNFLRRLPFASKYDLSISTLSCIAVSEILNELFLENIDNAVSSQIANEGGIELIVDSIRKYVRPVIVPSSRNINYSHYRLELKGGDILAHLAMFSDNDGRLPLHYAADRGLLPSSEGRMTVLEHLLKVYPEAATVRDGSGRLPLHIAIGWNAPLSVLELLLHAAPDAGEAVCRRHDDIMLNLPPVLMAAASDCDLECIFALLRCDPTITKRQVTFVSRKRKSPPA